MRARSLLSLLLVLGLCSPGLTCAAAAPAAAAQHEVAATPPSLAPMLTRVSPAVVNISVQGSKVRPPQDPILQDPLFRRFFGLPDDPDSQATPSERFQAAGSGVIYDAARGYVITNSHVVAQAEKIMVTLKDRRRLEATLVGTDPQTDIAVLKVSPDHLTAMPMGDSKALQVGDYVVAIGNPFGLGQTATFGIVSATGRSGLGIEGYEDFIQTDAAVNPGNSGGALVDMQGRVIGINAAIVSRGGGNLGIGFAIPIDMVKGVVQQLVQSGKVARGTLGISIQDLTPALAQAIGVGVTNGAIVAQVTPQSAAARAGILEGDIIVAMDGEAVTSASQLRNVIGQKQPGSAIRIRVLRDSKELTVTATLEPQTASASTPAAPRDETTVDGVTLGAIPKNNPNFGKVRGIYVVSITVGSAFDEAGLQAGDIIVSAGRTPVSTPSDFAQIMRSRKQGVPMLLQIRRGETSLYLALG
jgi:Do/DeqQ family serine protease